MYTLTKFKHLNQCIVDADFTSDEILKPGDCFVCLNDRSMIVDCFVYHHQESRAHLHDSYGKNILTVTFLNAR